MATLPATVPFKDGTGHNELMLALDLSGTGAGPYAPSHSISDSAGVIINPAQEGTDASGVSPPTGADGIRGWLSGIYSRLGGAAVIGKVGLQVAGADVSAANPVTIGGISVVAGASFARPADTTAYALGDLIANSTTAGSVVPMAPVVARINGGTGRIKRGRLTKSNTVTTNATFRAHIYKNSPTPANGDNGVFSTDQALGYIGSMDFDMTGANARAFTDGVKCIATPNVGTEILFDCGSSVQTLYALLEARAAYTPASAETFTLALEVSRD